MKTISKISILAAALSVSTALPALASDCSDGRLWVPDNNKTVEINGFCKDVNIAGNNNTITVGRIGDLKVGGDNNIINYREKTSGVEPKHWFGGNGNKLVFIGDSAAKAAPAKRAASKRAPASKTKSAKVSAPASLKGRAPLLVDIPGPRVKVTGKMLGKLPAGYRMHVSTTNYWTNSAMTATRMKHLTLTKDGQFEKGRFSVSGGSSVGPSVGVITSSNKNGSTGSVMGNTNPSGPGAKSVYLKKRDGLDPAMYGTYYISGNKIELRYANGKSVTHSFKTDGYKRIILDDKKYFSDAPDGWERKKNNDRYKYRSLDGAYTASVSKIDGSQPDGVKWLKNYITRAKAKNMLVSASPIKKLNENRLGVVKSTLVMRDPGGSGTFTRDVYVRYGGNSTVSRFVNVTRYKGASGDKVMLAFIDDLD